MDRPGQGMASIVVVDDDDMVRRTMVTVLGMAGHAVREASGGHGGLALVEDSAPDLLITDINMPGMDGVSFIAAARGIRPDLKVLAISGSSPRAIDDPAIAATLGADAVIGKPFRRADLLACIARLSGDAATSGDGTTPGDAAAPRDRG